MQFAPDEIGILDSPCPVLPYMERSGIGVVLMTTAIATIAVDLHGRWLWKRYGRGRGTCGTNRCSAY